MIKDYCVQNNGDCSTCSLVNYNRDCQNNPIHGGRRAGAGRPPTDRQPITRQVTEKEKIAIDNLLKELRTTK